MEAAKKDDLLAGIDSMLAQERTREIRELTGADIALLRPEDWTECRSWETRQVSAPQGALPAFGSALMRKQAAGAQPKKKEFSRQANPSGFVSSVANAKHAIEELGIRLRLDVFHQRLEIDGYERPAGESIDSTVLKLRNEIIEEYGFDPGQQHTFDAARILAMQNSFDPVLEYLEALTWDGVPRLDKWLSTYLGAQDDPLTRAIGRAVLIGGVRRVRKPGCKFDFMLVLESPQGRGKSTVPLILAGGADNFTDQLDFRMTYKEVQEVLGGKWIVECPELHGLSQTDVRKAKQAISRTEDRARPAFGRSVEDVPRRCIFIGTTNDESYLRDETGNRRFWPVATGLIDLAALRADRDQLWAEAAAAEPRAGEPVTIPEELWDAARERQAARVAGDPWEDILAEGLAERAKATEGEWRIKANDLFPWILEPAGIRQTNPKRIAACMKKLGWDGPKVVRWGDKTIRSYVKPCT